MDFGRGAIGLGEQHHRTRTGRYSSVCKIGVRKNRTASLCEAQPQDIDTRGATASPEQAKTLFLRMVDCQKTVEHRRVVNPRIMRLDQPYEPPDGFLQIVRDQYPFAGEPPPESIAKADLWLARDVRVIHIVVAVPDTTC